MDITCIPMLCGFFYLAAVIASFSRKGMTWRLWITMDGGFCIEVVSKARASIRRDLDFCNGRRVHHALAGQTPDQAFINARQPIPAAAQPQGELLTGGTEAIQLSRATSS
jgi:hypothetical protein